jgi:hypothetical protein
MPRRDGGLTWLAVRQSGTRQSGKDPRAAGEAGWNWSSPVPPGSWLILSVGHTEDDDARTALQPAYAAVQTFRHSVKDFTSFFAGTAIVPPGITEARLWIAGISAPPLRIYVLAGAGIKR